MGARNASAGWGVEEGGGTVWGPLLEGVISMVAVGGASVPLIPCPHLQSLLCIHLQQINLVVGGSASPPGGSPVLGGFSSVRGLCRAYVEQPGNSRDFTPQGQPSTSEEWK